MKVRLGREVYDTVLGVVAGQPRLVFGGMSLSPKMAAEVRCRIEEGTTEEAARLKVAGFPPPEILVSVKPPTPPPAPIPVQPVPRVPPMGRCKARVVTFDPWFGEGYFEIVEPRSTVRVKFHLRELPWPTREALWEQGCPLARLHKKHGWTEAEVQERRDHLVGYMIDRSFEFEVTHDEKHPRPRVRKDSARELSGGQELPPRPPTPPTPFTRRQGGVSIWRSGETGESVEQRRARQIARGRRRNPSEAPKPRPE